MAMTLLGYSPAANRIAEPPSASTGHWDAAASDDLLLRLAPPSRFRPLPPSHDRGVLDALIISDLHLGSENCQAKPLAALLESLLAGAGGKPGAPRTHRLIINGDVFDSIDFRRLKKTHWKVLSLIRHLSDKIEVIWIGGNHDGSADIVSPLLGVTVKEEVIIESGGKAILFIHGHRFDDFITDHPALTWFADCIYEALQKVDPSHHVARFAKHRSKTFVRCLDKIQQRSIEHARKLGCQAVVCGHTHHAMALTVGDVHYYNSGCWTERPCTYLTLQAGAIELHSQLEEAERPALWAVA